MTGRHEAPPLGSAARDATAPPYHGRHRAEDAAAWLLSHPPGMEPPRWIDGSPPDCPNCTLGYLLLNGGPHCPNCGWSERAGRVADERWSDPEDTHQGSPDDV